MQLSDSVDCPVNAQMQQLTVEAAALVFCLKLYNPETQNAFVNGKMDEGRAASDGPGPAVYSMLLVSTFMPTEWSTSFCPALPDHFQHRLASSCCIAMQFSSNMLCCPDLAVCYLSAGGLHFCSVAQSFSACTLRSEMS